MRDGGPIELLPGDGAGRLICDAADRYRAFEAEALAPHGLTPSAGRLLRALWRPPHQGDAKVPAAVASGPLGLSPPHLGDDHVPAASAAGREDHAHDHPWWGQAEAVQRSRLPAMDVSRLLAAFERRALVERGPRVGRGRTVRLTSQGAELARLAARAAYEAERRFLRPLGADRGGLRPLLRQLVRLERPARADG